MTSQRGTVVAMDVYVEMLTAAQIEALLVAVLSVSQYSIDRVQRMVPAFRETGLTDPARAATMDLGEITVALSRSGYNRGLLTSMYGERVQALMKAIQNGQLHELSAAIVSADESAFVTRLRCIYGIGPKVAANAWALIMPNRPT
jgi:hypothetical protein